MLRYADELGNPAVIFEDVPTGKPNKEMVDLAIELIERKAGKFEPEDFENSRRAETLRRLLGTSSGPSYRRRGSM